MIKPKFTKSKSKRQKWSEISSRFCAYHGLPYGSAIKVIYVNSPKYQMGRVQRDNTVYTRALFKGKKIAQADDSLSVHDLINDHLLPYLDIDLNAMGARIAGFYPDGSEITQPARTYVSKWKKQPALPTNEEVEAEDQRQQQITEIADEVGRHILDLEEFRWNPEELVPHAVLRALIDRYGIDEIERILKAEKSRK